MNAIDNPVAADNLPAGVAVYPHVAGWDAEPLDATRFALSPWARWIAADADGQVWEYAHKPRMSLEWWVIQGRGVCHIGDIDMAGIDWRQTLTPVNQDTEPTNNVANIVSAVAEFSTAELVLFARLLCAADGEKASWLIDALIMVLEVEPDPECHERIEAAILAGAGALE